MMALCPAVYMTKDGKELCSIHDTISGRNSGEAVCNDKYSVPPHDTIQCLLYYCLAV